MRFPLIFHGSYTLWIFISAGREACEACFIQPLTDYLFVNISHHFPVSKPQGGLGILTSTPTECKVGSQIECRASSPARHDSVPSSVHWGSKLAKYLEIDPTHNYSVSITGHLMYNLQSVQVILAAVAQRRPQQQPQLSVDFPFISYQPKCHSAVLPETTFLADLKQTIERVERLNMIKKLSAASVAGASVRNWITNGEHK